MAKCLHEGCDLDARPDPNYCELHDGIVLKGNKWGIVGDFPDAAEEPPSAPAADAEPDGGPPDPASDPSVG